MSERAIAMWGDRLTFRGVFTAVGAFLFLVAALTGVRWPRQALIPHSALALQQLLTEAPDVDNPTCDE